MGSLASEEAFVGDSITITSIRFMYIVVSEWVENTSSMADLAGL